MNVVGRDGRRPANSCEGLGCRGTRGPDGGDDHDDGNKLLKLEFASIALDTQQQYLLGGETDL